MSKKIYLFSALLLTVTLSLAACGGGAERVSQPTLSPTPAGDPAAGKKLFEDKGGAVYQLPSVEKDKWMKTSMTIKTNWIMDMEAKGLPGQAVLDYAETQLGKTP